ncbi:MAG TPA: methionyl-tRNA formyltransferase [Gemmataceae bacterium]|nr:methionyl-tRNA formyltransferase [Gemmataceae bacterium]
MRVVMMGTGTFAEPTFEALLAGPHPVVGLVTQPDRPGGHERGSTRQTGQGMKNIALRHNVPVYQPESVNTPEGVAQLRAWQPDLLVVAAYGQILSRDVLAVPGQGGINVHASLLPKYRGAAPIAWAVYHGETRTGVTIIRMSVQLDAGDMLAQEALAIRPDETAGELEARLAPLGSRMAMEAVERIASGTACGITQDKTQATKAPKLTKEHGLIDWSRTAEQVCNHIRAMQPWPTAYTFLHRAGQAPLRLIVNKAAPQPADGQHEPGAAVVVAGEPLRLRVAAGSGTVVEVLELQPAGKRRMAAAEFLRGHRLHAGDRFGPASA